MLPLMLEPPPPAPPPPAPPAKTSLSLKLGALAVINLLDAVFCFLVVLYLLLPPLANFHGGSSPQEDRLWLIALLGFALLTLLFPATTIRIFFCRSWAWWLSLFLLGSFALLGAALLIAALLEAVTSDPSRGRAIFSNLLFLFPFVAVHAFAVLLLFYPDVRGQFGSSTRHP